MNELLLEVKRMRQFQKDFYKKPSPSVMEIRNHSEKTVDYLIQQIELIASPETLPSFIPGSDYDHAFCKANLLWKEKLQHQIEDLHTEFQSLSTVSKSGMKAYQKAIEELKKGLYWSTDPSETELI